MIHIALAGNPNCGKTTLFNLMTGATAYVGNWPGVTVEKREGVYRKKGSKNKEEGINVVDLPGIYSLSPYTPEEVISRNYILQERPDVVVNVLDGTNLERNLYMTTQILEMDVPVVVAINMIDAVESANQSIDLKKLEKELGVPVVAISALRDKGLDDLVNAIEKAAKTTRIGSSVIKDPILEEAKKIYAEANIEHPLFHAIKALEKDEIELSENRVAAGKVLALGDATGKDYEAEIADLRYSYLTPICEEAVKGRVKQESAKLSKSDKIDKVLTHRVFGILILLVVLFLVFHFTFSDDLFYLGAMGVNFGGGYEGLIKINFGADYNAAFGGEVDYEAYAPFAGLFFSENGVSSIGQFFVVIVEGICGLINEAFRAMLFYAGASGWVMDLFYSGILGGVFAVLGFLPQILVLFVFFSILEDSGYMARIAFIIDRIFRKFGVSGRAFIPMFMGFGCGIPAMINTRTLSTEKEKTKTIRVIPFFTCGAKNEYLLMIAAVIGTLIGFSTDLFVLLIYLFGVIIAMISVIVMNKTSQREVAPPFIMELPAYHRPQIRALFIHVWDKGKHFIKKAFTIILVSTIVVWFLASFGWHTDMETGATVFGYMDAADGATSLLGYIGTGLSYLFIPLGFGATQAGAEAWKFAVACVEGIVAKEGVTAVLETLEIEIGSISIAGWVAFAVFNLFTIPCFASVATAKGELNNRKSFWFTVLFWLALSYLLGVAAYLIFEWVWTLAIILPLVAAGVVALILYDRKKSKSEALASAN